jgi:hypothetical protein
VLVVAIVLMMTQHTALLHPMLHTCLYPSDPSFHLSYRRCSLRCALIHPTHLTCLTHSSQVLIALRSHPPHSPHLPYPFIVGAHCTVCRRDGAADLNRPSNAVCHTHQTEFEEHAHCQHSAGAVACSAVDRPVRIAHLNQMLLSRNGPLQRD